MIIYDIFNTPVPSVNYCDGLDRCILYCILLVFMLALLCFCVATEFSVNRDFIYSKRPRCTEAGSVDLIAVKLLGISVNLQQDLEAAVLSLVSVATVSCLRISLIYGRHCSESGLHVVG